MKFHLEGFPELEAALGEIAKQATRVAITRRALGKAAEPMRDLAKRYAPIGDYAARDEGRLNENIIISARATNEVGAAAYSRTLRAGGDKISALSAMRDARRAFRAANPPAILYLGPSEDIWWAGFPEFGTRPRVNGGAFAGTQHPGTAPDPYLRPAFDAEANPTIDRLAAAMRIEIDKSAKRAARKAAKKG